MTDLPDHQGPDDQGPDDQAPGDQPVATAPASTGATDLALTITRIAAQAAADKLARDVVAFDVSAHLAITDVFLIASAPNERQVGAIVDGIEEALVKRGFKPARREGDRENRWVLLDYIDVVVHVQHDEERQLYSLERLWRDCPPIPLHLDVPAGAAAATEE